MPWRFRPHVVIPSVLRASGGRKLPFTAEAEALPRRRICFSAGQLVFGDTCKQASKAGPYRGEEDVIHVC